MRSAAWAGDQPVTQTFDDPCYRAAYARFGYAGHNGVDLGCWSGTVLTAMRPGVVDWSGYDRSGYGELVILRYDDDQSCWYYGHQRERLVVTGARVAAGARIGVSGNTGNSSGPHLHIGKRPAGYDPANGFGGFVDPTAELLASLRPAVPPTAPAAWLATPTAEELATMSDWELINWVAQPLWDWAGLGDAFNPESGLVKTWVAATRAGHYPGRPRTGERPFGGESEAAPSGYWQEFEHETLIYTLDGAMSWTG